jgi:hypothetical protein
MKYEIDKSRSQLVIIEMESYDVTIQTAVYHDVIAVTLRTVNYTTADLNKLMIIKINDGFDQSDYYSGEGKKRVFKALPLYRKNDADYIYSNGEQDYYESKFIHNPISVLDKFRIQVLLDGENATDITPSNKLFIEMELFFADTLKK